MLVEVRVKSLGLLRPSNDPLVILQEDEGERVLLIFIGPSEAQAICVQLNNYKVKRPLTHDLFISLLGGLEGELQRVVITRVVDNTYYAELIIKQNGHEVSVDARPSDSIAIALRAEATILADDSLLEVASFDIASDDEDFTEIEPEAAGPEADPKAMDPEELQAYLRTLAPEDFGRFKP